MKRNDNEIADGVTHTAEADKENGGIRRGEFGKFKDLETLLNAYDSLEAEFTRRSQRLREFEREAATREKREENAPTEPSGGQESAAEKFLKTFPRAKAYSSEIAASAAERNDLAAGNLERAYIRLLEENIGKAESKLNDKDFLLAKVSEDPTVSEEVVKTYLRSIIRSKPRAAFGGGSALAIPPRKPNTIAEASAMTEKYLNEKGDLPKW